MTNWLVTGASGFIGRNLVLAAGRRPDIRLTATDVDSPREDLFRTLGDCDAVIHLAGVNRPRDEADFETGNVGALREILDELERRGRAPAVLLSSSTQAALDNPYGRSKKRAEALLVEFARRTGAAAWIFRLPGVFGKWCRPDYNSVVATFCHRLARDLPIRVSDPDRTIEIVHVDDVIGAFFEALGGPRAARGPAEPFGSVEPVFTVTLGRLAELIREFRASRDSLRQPDLGDPFLRRLYGTYMSYLPEDGFDYALRRNVDARGALAELFKLGGHGQVFVSRTLPGRMRGQHYHDLKVEKFVVLEGAGVIRFRQLATGARVDIPVRGEEMRVVDIPPGWTHAVENVGEGDLVILFWASEPFDPDRPDTYRAEVQS
jgi:UDP-2-acetamido-2,6-beta-L-arabino-hexul-4-ose reductase